MLFWLVRLMKYKLLKSLIFDFRKKTIDRKLDFWNLHWLLILLYQKGWFGNELLLDKNDFTPPKVSQQILMWFGILGSAQSLRLTKMKPSKVLSKTTGSLEISLEIRSN